MKQKASDRASGELLDRLPPCDLDAERALLGSVILNGDLLPWLAADVEVHDFYDTRHRALYRVLVAMPRGGVKAVDAVTLRDAIQCHATMEAAGGAAYLGEVILSVPVWQHYQYYADIVQRRAAERRAIATLEEMLVAAHESAYQDPAALCRRVLESFGRMQQWLRARGIGTDKAAAAAKEE